jgi:transitional endoplasmic reticulum ATPase
MPENLKLKISEALTKDVGRAIVRLDPSDLQKIGVNIGDTVQVAGKRTTVCKAMPMYKDLRGQNRIQMDGVTRENVGGGLDEFVNIKKLNIPAAEKVTFTTLSVVPDDKDLAYIGSLIDGLPVTVGDKVRVNLFGSRFVEFIVENVSPKDSALIQANTLLQVSESKPDAKNLSKVNSLSYEDIGGLRPQVARIREIIELPLRYPEVFERLGIDAPKGVLLHGSPGCGKTLIARAIASETDANFFTISGPEIVHKHYGESEANLRKIFEEASKKSPSIIFIDEIDAIAPRRETTQGEVEKRVVAQLLSLMDGLNRRANIVVLAATNLPNNLDPALRRPGRFDREITIPIPDRNGRREILEIHSNGMPLAQDVDLDRLAELSHGFVGADLEALCRESAMNSLRKILPEIDFSLSAVPYEKIAGLEVTMENFLSALHEIEPTAMREVFVEVPNVRWSDIGGLQEIKEQLQEAVIFPLQHADLFAKAHVKPPKGILLAGAPGCGKTLLAKAAATETKVNFIAVKGAELLSKYVGESERAMREIFKKAKQAAPCIIFFDEIDAIVPTRSGESGNNVSERVLAQFLAEMDGVEELKGVLVLGATNRLDRLDSAVLRPGRFDVVIELGLPSEADRIEVFEVHLRNKPTDKNIDLKQLAVETEGFSAAEISGVCQRAALNAVKRAIVAKSHEVKIYSEDLQIAIQNA